MQCVPMHNHFHCTVQQMYLDIKFQLHSLKLVAKWLLCTKSTEFEFKTNSTGCQLQYFEQHKCVLKLLASEDAPLAAEFENNNISDQTENKILVLFVNLIGWNWKCKALNIDFIFCKNLLHYWINICKPKSYDKCFLKMYEVWFMSSSAQPWHVKTNVHLNFK